MSWLIAGFILYILLVVAERAVVAVTPHETELLRAEGTPSARRALSVVGDHSRRAIAALSIGRTLLLVTMTGTVAMSAPAMMAGLQDSWLRIPHQFLSGTASPVFLKIGTGLLFALVFSGLLWRVHRISLRRAQRPVAAFWLSRLSFLPRLCMLLFRPLLPPVVVPSVAVTPPVSDTGKRRDIEMLKSISKFGYVNVRQVMQPLPKMVGIDRNTRFDEVIQIIQQSGFSRLPVFEDDLDHILGILYVKDLVNSTQESADFDWFPLVRTDILVVPESKHIDELLQEFKRQKKHLALVVDEYGGTSGLVTMEDVLEEVTGEIRDEFDDENEIPPYTQLDENNFYFAGTTMINDVCSIAGIDPATFDEVRDDADTIAGLILTLIGDIPKPGDQTRWGQYLFTIEEADERRIEAVRFTIGATLP